MDLEFHQLDLRYEGLRVRRLERERRLLASLAERGQQVPIVVIALTGEANRFLVIDGYKRIRALQRLGQDTVRVTVWDMNETEALVLDRSLRTAEGETALEQGWLLAELHRSFGLTLDDLARRFYRSVSWVSRRLALVGELPDSIQQRVRRGEIGAQAAMKYLVPMARAKRYDCERLAEAIAWHKFTTHEVGQLCAAWRNGSPCVRERLPCANCCAWPGSIPATAARLLFRRSRSCRRRRPAGDGLLPQSLQRPQSVQAAMANSGKSPKATTL